MSTARIEGDNLRITVRGATLEADWIEVSAAPDQPGTILTGRLGKSGGISWVYIDKDGEPCNETTVRFALSRRSE